MNKKNKRKKRKSYYKVIGSPKNLKDLKKLSYLTDGPMPKGIRIKPRKGYRLTNRVYRNYGKRPYYVNGYKVVDWVQTYFGSDAYKDEFKPIVDLSIRRSRKHRRKAKRSKEFQQIMVAMIIILIIITLLKLLGVI